MRRKGSLFQLEDSCNRYSHQPHGKGKKNSRKKRNKEEASPTPPPPKLTQSLGSHYDYGQPIHLSFSGSYDQVESGYDSAEAMNTYEQDDPFGRFGETFMEEPFEDVLVVESDEQKESKPAMKVTPSPQSSKEQVSKEPPASLVLSPQADSTQLSYPEDDAFENDIRAILSNQKQYDKAQKRMVDLPDRQHASEQAPPPPNPSEESKENEHAIFDKISQSMKMANSFDLGSIALEHRFDQFDEELDQEDSEKKK
ncbi:MAG: hypothetical protein AAF587_37605 [Bacteroidota bacterium]